MKKLISNIVLLALLVGIMSSCTNVEPLDLDDMAQASLLERDMKRWAEERELQKKQDESDKAFLDRIQSMYDAYYESIREYKKSDHKIVYGWYSGWAATKGVDRSFLTNIPDSVDIVALWGGIPAFTEDDPRWEDLRIAQEVKGLKVVLCWQTGMSGLGLPGGVEEFDKRHEDKTAVEKAVAYAQELTEFIKKHNLNGYDIDWEPHVGDHGYGACNNLYSNCEGGDSSAPIRAFIEEMGKNFGPKQTTDYNPRGTGTLFLFDGEVGDMANRFGDLGSYFDYFINQNYNSVAPNYEFSETNKIADWNWKKYIAADEFEKDATNAGICSKGSDGTLCAYRKAAYIRDRNYGGWAAYHIELDKDYVHTRKVIQIMNPSSYYKPDDKINQLIRP